MSKFTRSFVYAANGLKLCLLKEANFRIHIFLSVITIALSILLNINAVEWMIILFCMAFVLSMEMINTAIEQLCNVVHKEDHPGIKIVKDVSAGAVLVSAILAAICGAVIFIPKILSFIPSN